MAKAKPENIVLTGRERQLANLKNGKATEFKKDNQPSGEAKSRGWSRKRTLKDLLNLSTSNLLPGAKNDYRKLAADYFDIEETKVTVKMVMEFRQIEKAILKGDTAAYTAINDRAYGKPAQQVQLADNKGGALAVNLIFKDAENCEPLKQESEE